MRDREDESLAYMASLLLWHRNILWVPFPSLQQISYIGVGRLI